MMVKIALKGYARSGKDTVAELIKEYFNVKGHGETQKMAFGDELRSRFHRAFPEIPKTPKPRQAYEHFGEMARGIDEDFWVKVVASKMNYWEDFYNNFIISDLRQPNEAKWCKENGFIIIEVWCPDKARKERSDNDTTFVPINHSERNISLIEHDYTIYNVDGFESLAEQIKEIMEEIIIEKSIS